MNASHVLYLLLISLCISCRKDSPVEVTIQKLEFGEGGGIVGIKTIYTISRDGEVTKTFNGTAQQIKVISADIAQQKIDAFAKFVNYEYSDPGNIYSFIDITADNKTNSIIWNSSSKNINPDVLKLYDELIALTR